MRLKKPAAAQFYVRLIETLRKQKLPTSQTWIAKQLGVYQSAIAKWKGGEGFPSKDNLVRLSKITGESVGYLLTGRHNPTGLGVGAVDELTHDMLVDWDSLTDADRQEVVRFIRFKLAARQAVIPALPAPPDSTKKR